MKKGGDPTTVLFAQYSVELSFLLTRGLATCISLPTTICLVTCFVSVVTHTSEFCRDNFTIITAFPTLGT